MSRSRLFLFSLFVLALLAGLSPAWADGGATPTPDLQAVIAAPAPGGGCQPALDLASANSCPAPTPAALPNQIPEPEFLGNKHLGYCHCGCGPATCRTSADCGGASCDRFVSCC